MARGGITVVWVTLTLAVVAWTLSSYLTISRFRRNARYDRRRVISLDVQHLNATLPEVLQMMRNDPANPVPAIRFAVFADQAHDWPELRKRAEEVVRHFPGLVDGYLLLARALWAMQEAGAARAVMRRTIRRFPEDDEALEFAIHLARMEPDWRRMTRLGRKLERKSCSSINSYRYQVEALIQLGRLDDVVKVLRRAERFVPEDKQLPELWKLYDDAFSKTEEAAT
jgi:L-fucose mutarotase/ribose pyranase (RbsD/FucU family)